MLVAGNGCQTVYVVGNCLSCMPTSAPPCPPTQVLLDWELGDMTGLEVLRHIKKQSPDTTTRLIMVSGNEPSSEERAEFQEVRLTHRTQPRAPPARTALI